MNIIFDLDGTLIDSRDRLYRLFQKLNPASCLTFDEYWAIKKNRVSNELILVNEFNFNKVDIENFLSAWMVEIESEDFLMLDTVFPYTEQTLKTLSSVAKIYICTARQHRTLVLKQLKEFGLIEYFQDIFVTEQKLNKQELISKISSLDNSDWIIGDTGKDILAGKDLGIKTCAVLSGFLNAEQLEQYNPNIILKNISSFCGYVHN